MIRSYKTWLLVALTFLPACAKLSRWETHTKENTEPANAKIEAPFNQIREPGRDDPYLPQTQALGEKNLERPQVVETLLDPNRSAILTGIPLEGRPGFVLSPYAPDKGLVDVSGFPPGTDVRDPYTGQIMKVPPLATQTPADPLAKPKPEPADNAIPQIEN